MNYNKKSIEDIDVAGKRVLCRCDFNVPTKDGKITSDKRIVQGKRKDAGFLNTRGHVLMGSLQLRDSQMRVHTEHGWKMAGLQVHGHKEDSAK